MRPTNRRITGLVVVGLIVCVLGFAETGEAGWLRYARQPKAAQYQGLPSTVLVLGNSPALRTAQSELVRGMEGMLGRKLRVVSAPTAAPIIVIGTLDELTKIEPTLVSRTKLHSDGYWIAWRKIRSQRALVIAGANDRGALYGTFALLSKIARGERVEALDEIQNPSAQLRWVNQWDNLDGSIERGYGGRSIFYEDRKVRQDLTRVMEYARLLASVGINGCGVTNVNADLHILDSEFIPQLARIADDFRPYGIRLGVAVNVSTPKQAGGLDTFDPLDPKVAAWWKTKIDEVYRQIPDFGGIIVKADSEGQLGPSVYGRNPADAANVIARALIPHGGIVFYRAFVYNHHLDWNDPKADRARAAYDIFHPLDGKFDDNVVIQIKYGPIDFQVREPVSPLLGGLEKTNIAVELQIAQEYMGQQRHTVFQVPMWKEVLDFDLKVNSEHTPVKEIVAGRSFDRPTGGYVGVVNAGVSPTWLGNRLAMANLYGFGRLAWNPDLSAKTIVDEWTALTFGNDPEVVRKVGDIQLASWPTYESYTGVLGLQTLTNIVGPHYGPGPDSQERNGWGQWIRAEKDAVGMDRSVATGTGYVGQYSAEVQKIYENAAITPDELLTFFHHVPYTYKLHSGKTVIQTIYDSHYDGARRASQFPQTWASLKGKIDDQRYDEVLRQLTYQAGHAIVWRDAINDWFHEKSGIPDALGRVGNHPGRIEAEAMELDGYEVADVDYWEGASGGKAVACQQGRNRCAVSTKFKGKAGQYDISVEYFDQNNGVSRFEVLVDGKPVDTWTAEMALPTKKPDADSSTRRTIQKVKLRPGDEIRIEGTPDGEERAPLDYVEIVPVPPNSHAF